MCIYKKGVFLSLENSLEHYSLNKNYFYTTIFLRKSCMNFYKIVQNNNIKQYSCHVFLCFSDK